MQQPLTREQRPRIGLTEAGRRMGRTGRHLLNLVKKGVIPWAWQSAPNCPWEIDECTFEAWRREIGDPNALPADHFDCEPLAYQLSGSGQSGAKDEESAA